MSVAVGKDGVVSAGGSVGSGEGMAMPGCTVGANGVGDAAELVAIALVGARVAVMRPAVGWGVSVTSPAQAARKIARIK